MEVESILLFFESTTLRIHVEINGILNLTPIQFCIAKVRFFVANLETSFLNCAQIAHFEHLYENFSLGVYVST